MGFMDIIKNQFINVIEYVDENNKIIISQYTKSNNEIRQGAKVIVREGQAAVFLKDGSLADILYSGPYKLDLEKSNDIKTENNGFKTGTYTLNTESLPKLSNLDNFKYNSPIKADLYFVSLKQFIDNKWGTKSPILRRDKDFKFVRIRAFGKYAFRIVDVKKFMSEIFLIHGKVLTYDIVEYLSSLLTEAISTTIAYSEIPVIDLPIKYRELAIKAQEAVNSFSLSLGIEFSNIIIESISLPDEVEEMIDEQSGISMANDDMNTFVQYQTARAMRDAAKQVDGLSKIDSLANTLNNMSNNNKNEKSTAERLRELKSLLDEGILTNEEFTAMKKQILEL